MDSLSDIITPNATTPTVLTSNATSVFTSISTSPVPYPSRSDCANVPLLNIEKNIPQKTATDVITCFLDLKKNQNDNNDNEIDNSCGDSRLSFTTVSTAVNTSTCNTANVSTNTSANPILSPAESLKEISIDKITRCHSDTLIVNNNEKMHHYQNNVDDISIDKINNDNIMEMHSLAGGVTVPISYAKLTLISPSIPKEGTVLNSILSTAPVSVSLSSPVSRSTPLSLFLPPEDPIPVSVLGPIPVSVPGPIPVSVPGPIPMPVPVPVPISDRNPITNPNTNAESSETVNVKNVESESESGLKIGARTGTGASTRMATPSWAAVGGYDHPQPGSRLLQYGKKVVYTLNSSICLSCIIPSMFYEKM